MNNTLYLTLVVQVVLPLVVGLVTKKSLPAHLKFCLLAVLTALNTGILGYLAGSSLTDLLLAGGIGLLTSIGTHYGFYKPLGATEVAQNSLIKDKVVEVAPEAEEPTEDAASDSEEEHAVDEAEQEAEVLDPSVEYAENTTDLEGTPTLEKG